MAAPDRTGFEVLKDTETAARGPLSPMQSRLAKVAGCVCFGSFCCYAVLVVVLAFVAKTTALGVNQFKPLHQVYDKEGNFVTPQNVSAYEWWPGCNTNEADEVSNCGTMCCNCELRDAFRKHNAKAPFKYVWFPSREGPSGEVENITAWWLPVAGEDEAGPAIVLQHGMGGSINDARPAVAAFLLRSAGFPVLMPNMRGHGSASHSSHGHKSWGWEYPYDTLGAWDYLVNDPDNKLGGKRDASQVGIMGFSMGGFTAASAFGLEPQAPALWLDGALYDPLDLLLRSLPLPRFLLAPAWQLMELMTGVPMRSNLPRKTLEEACAEGDGPKPRPVMIVGSKDDTDVPMEVSNRYMNVLEGQGTCYKAESNFAMSGTCNEHNHNVLIWTAAADYRQALCDFWSRALLDSECQAAAPVF